MDTEIRLRLLTQQMSFEPAEEHGRALQECRQIDPDDIFIHRAVLPNGKRIKLLKTLLSSVCERDCFYCPFRAGRDFRRATFHPEEFAKMFSTLSTSGIAEGIFLSSGVAGGGSRTQNRLIETIDILRHKYGYRGYVHLKLMPGVEKGQVEVAMRLADRVSINLEAPNNSRLRHLTHQKRYYEELLQPLEWIHEIRQTQPAHKSITGHWPSSVTQFVAGGSGESDLELMTTTEYLYTKLGLKRVYYSPFTPIEGTPLDNLQPTSPVREQRLYQASFLLRDYGFTMEELPFDTWGNLPTSEDPKVASAKYHLNDTPVELNRAETHELLRVPGIGPRSANAIIKLRKQVVIKDISSLKKLGVSADRAAPFILLNGKRPEIQLSLLS